jgi:hypothetical protein
MSDVPTLTEVLESAIRGVLDDVRVLLPGKVLAYDNGRATVQVLSMDAYTGEDGARKAEPLAILPDVPVAQVGFGTARIRVTPKVNARCWVAFASSSIARLKAGASGIYDPGDDRHHHIADAIVLPIAAIGEEDADAMIEFTDTEIRCGGTSPLVTRAEFLNHGHATAANGPVSPPIASPAPGSSLVFPGTGKLRG